MVKKEGMWPERAPTKRRRDEAKIAPFRPPNADRATARGMVQAKEPSMRLPNATATVGDSSSSSGLRTAKYAMFAST